MSVFDPAERREDGLRTDLYQLTMAAAMFEAGVQERTSFELFTRSLPETRGYWVACGLEIALEYLEGLKFTKAEIDYLKAHPVFGGVSQEFFEFLSSFRFQGEVWAPPEGTVLFPWEPLLRVTGTAIEAQLVETYLLSVINAQTLIASKAARVAEACGRKAFADFGTRRAHGPGAGELAARAAFVGGAMGTSNVEAGMRLGLPIVGTFAHSWVMMHDDELTAFRRYAAAFPDHTTLLIDTYDTLAAARAIVAEGIPCQAVRLDSGDLGDLSRRVRAVLDEGGREDVKIVASNDLNEHKIRTLEASGGAIDLYGVGTELVTSKDHPALGGVYKVVEVEAEGGPRYPIKCSSGKRSWPGRKQVYRKVEEGRFVGDVIALSSDQAPSGATPLLERVMFEGRRERSAPPLGDARAHCKTQREALPEGVRALTYATAYPVERSEAVVALADRIEAEVRSRLHERAQGSETS